MTHHHDGPRCDLCEFKLCLAHPIIGEWFLAAKNNWPNLHASWTFRDEISQNRAYADGLSMLKWPNSAHNAKLGDKPYSLAIDVFQIDDDGVARFSTKFCGLLWEWTEEKYPRVFLWGGNFKTLGDSGHFQLIDSTSSGAS